MKCASGRLPLARREPFYQICDSKAVLVSPFCGLVLHIPVSAFHELREKRHFWAATTFSITGRETMSPAESCPCVLEDKPGVPRSLGDSQCQECIWNVPSGLTLTGKCCWWKIPIESVANISLSSKNLCFDIPQLWMSQVILGQKRRLSNSLYNCVDHWNSWDRALYVQVLNLLSKSKYKKNIWPIAWAMSSIAANGLLSWKSCMASSPQSATQSAGGLDEVDDPEDGTWSCPWRKLRQKS